MRKVVVVGGGAAGMFAAYAAVSSGKSVILLEKNEKLGKKLYITGKGRCNLTNDVPVNEFFSNVVSNPKFLYGCINSFSPEDTIKFFTNNSLSLKTERGNRVFPSSDKASDVTKTLEKILVNSGVDVRLNTSVVSLIYDEQTVLGVKTNKGEIICDSVILCCGGVSYPLTGSTGDGYKFARSVGHNVIDLRPGLVGVELNGNEFLDAQGVSLKNVTLTAKINDKTVFSDFGEMLFTHFGVSGPLVLSCSSMINRLQLKDVKLQIDLKPALSYNVLDDRLIREFKENKSKEIQTVMRALLPKSLIKMVLNQSKVNAYKGCSEITQAERANIVDALKRLEFSVKKLRPIDEAIITSGGVCVKEINPKTMESKLRKGLYFAGEVLDVDAFTGGFNIQIAFSTGYAAGINC